MEWVVTEHACLHDAIHIERMSVRQVRNVCIISTARKSHAENGQYWLKACNHQHLSVQQAELSIGARQMPNARLSYYLVMLCRWNRDVTHVAQVCKSLRFSGVSVPRDYEQGFQRALWTFQHQRVWCPQRKQLVHLRPLPEGGLAAGRCCPSSSTMLRYVTVRTVVSVNLIDSWDAQDRLALHVLGSS